jgi:2-methylcitrate dehydratase PrpD
MPNQPTSPTTEIAEFAAVCAFADIPGGVVDLAKKSILDALGVGLAGSADEGAGILRGYVESFGGAGSAALLGSSTAAPPALAALSNGMAMHMDDYDDTLRSSVTDLDKGSVHPTAGILSAVLALGQAKGCSGEALLTAYLAGVEATAKIADALGPRHFRAGFHGTATCVGLGAAVAGAQLLGLSADGIATALGIAASGSAGLRENFGTMVKPYHAGQAAETGVMAAELASRGFTASGQILEASRGFFSAYGDGFDRRWIDGRLGDPWAFDDPGVWIKPFPSGMRTHPGMSVLQKLMKKHAFGAADVDQIKVRTNEAVYNTLLHHRPKTGLQGKFSMEFSLAIILRDGMAGVSAFTDETVRQPDIQAMITAVDYQAYSDAEAQAGGYTNVTTLLDIAMRDGGRVQERADFCKGSTDDPMSYQEVAEKIRECTLFRGANPASVETIIDQVERLEQLEDLSSLGHAIAGAFR